MNRTDLNKVAETILIPLFREVYGFANLKNLNSTEHPDYPGIDLGDDVARVSIQVTSSTDTGKVQHTLKQFVKYESHKKYDRLIIYMLKKKQESYSGNTYNEIVQDLFKFDKDSDILDYSNILHQISTFQVDQCLRVQGILEANFGEDTANDFVRVKTEDIRLEQLRSNQDSERARVAQTAEILTGQEIIVQQQTVELRQMLSEMLASINGNQNQNQTSVSAEEATISGKLDTARDFLENGRARVAQSILIKIRNEISEKTVSEEILFRIATQLGACAHELGDTDTAVIELKTALAYYPEDITALTNAATAASLVGNAKEALEFSQKVRSINSQSSIATSIYISALKHLGHSAKIESLLKDEIWITTDARCLATLGDIKLKEGKHAEAQNYLRASISIVDSEPLPHLFLAESILISIQQILHDNPPIPSKNHEFFLKNRKEAETALSKVIALTCDWDNHEMYLLALSNRAGVRAGLNLLREAEQDCDKVLAEKENHEIALRNKGQILLKRGEPERAAYYLNLIQNNNERSAANLVLASTYLSTAKFTKVIDLLTPIWETSTWEHDKIVIADMLMNAHSSLGNIETASQIATKLSMSYPEDADTLSVLSYQRMREGNSEQAIILLERAMLISQGLAHDWIIWQFARLLYMLKDYSRAAELYKSILDVNKDSPELREYLFSIYMLKQYSEALAIARSIRGIGSAIPMISEIEVSILEHLGDIDGAIRLLSELQKLDSQNQTYSVRLVILEIRRGNAIAAKETALKIRYETIKNDYELLMRMAFARNKLGMPDVLKFAYRALRISNNNTDVHEGYFHLLNELHPVEEAIISVAPDQIGIDCAVTLVRNNEPITLTILDENPTHSNEINTSHPYFAKLKGLRIGDQVVLQSGPFGDIIYTVSDIQSKYQTAFHENMKQFETGLLYSNNIFVVRSPL